MQNQELITQDWKENPDVTFHNQLRWESTEITNDYVALFTQVVVTSGKKNKGNRLHLFNFTLYTQCFLTVKLYIVIHQNPAKFLYLQSTFDLRLFASTWRDKRTNSVYSDSHIVYSSNKSSVRCLQLARILLFWCCRVIFPSVTINNIVPQNLISLSSVYEHARLFNVFSYQEIKFYFTVSSPGR